MTDNLPETKPLNEPPLGILITTALMKIKAELPSESLEAMVKKLIKDSLNYLTPEKKDFIRQHLAKLLYIPKILDQEKGIYVANDNKEAYPAAYIHIHTIDFTSMYELYVEINTWASKTNNYRPEDKFLNCYMIVIDELPSTIDLKVLELMAFIRRTFPNNPGRIYFKLLLRKDQYFNDDNTVSEKANTLNTSLKKSRLGEILDITIDQKEFIEICVRGITNENVAT